MTLEGDVDRLQSFLARRFGLRVDSGRMGPIAEVLRTRAERTGRAMGAYVTWLDRPEARDELRVLVHEFTVGETYFFRNIDQFRALRELALPERARSHGAPLRILSAGCATGEEPYSLAIVVRSEVPEVAGRQVSIQAIDLDPAALEAAARARYSPWALRQTSGELRARWFRSEGRDFALDPTVRAMVAFEERNLVDDDPSFWQPDTFDVVFCRNVIMYFGQETAEVVVARIARSLAPGGFLFLGHAETLRGLSHDFHLRHTHDTFYYQRRDGSEPAPALFGEAAPKALAAAVDGDDSWVDSIRRASERVRALTSADPPTVEAARHPADLQRVLSLLREERYPEAGVLLRDLPPEAARDPDALLLGAVLLTHGGDLDEAERACALLLAADEMNAGAHYLMALYQERAGDPRRAAEHDQLAIYLDPGFAMPHLHLGLLARRAGDDGGARREFGEALALLHREDASRLLLFGGGFPREVLVALCRAELASRGGTP